jgi:DNA replication protein DnaC
LALAEGEANRRDQTRIARALSEAQLPYGKSWSNFEFSHVPSLNPAVIMQLAESTDWLHQAANILIFGPSGTGKTHLSSALGRSLLELGKRVKFIPATILVQHLQQAKLQLQLPVALVKLDRYDLVIMDDLGYVKKSEAETSVLFELIAHRYERKSLLITANQPFSQWDSIFTDSMMTVAAIDRLIHHATIIEIQAESFRKQAAFSRIQTP